MAAAQLLQDSCTNDKSHQGAGLPPPLAGPAFALAMLGFLSRAPWRRCGKAPPPARCSCLGLPDGGVWLSELQMRLLSEPLNSLRKANTPPPPSFPLQLQRTCHLGTQRQPFTREIKKDLGWLCQAQLPLKPKERLQEHGCLSVPFRELTYVPTAQVQAKAESGLMAHKAGVS